MRKTIFLLLMLVAGISNSAFSQRSCGIGMMLNKMSTTDPAKFYALRSQHAQMVAAAMAASQTASKNTAGASPIPVVFHFILTQQQFTILGGNTGITQRVTSQLQVLNEDYNAANADAANIPTPFVPFYANVGIKFGIAKATNANTISSGIEVKILSANDANTKFDFGDDCANAKTASNVGLAPWDNTKYINVWVVNVTYGGSLIILGCTVPHSFVGTSSGSYTFTNNDIGAVVNIGSFGKRALPTDYYVAGFDKGRSLTHELGHYFEIWHTWGDDANNQCPWPNSTYGQGQDDDIADTPPEANSVAGCPTFPTYDVCKLNGSVNMQPNGIMYMNYMDYANDTCMNMFSKGQSTVMNAQIAVGGESYGLTQNPGLLAVNDVVEKGSFTVAPNPTSGIVNISFQQNAVKLKSIEVLNMMGQSVQRISGNGASGYSIDLSGNSRGIYFVQCKFADGTLTQKIVLQ